MTRRLLSLLLLISASCAESGPPTLDTGLPRDVPADEVTPAEAQAACARYEALVEASLGASVQADLTCTLQGIASQLTGGDRCSSVRSSCLASAPVTVPIDFQCEAAVTFAPSGCTATIGALEDCVNAVSADVDALTSAVSCSIASDPAELLELVPLVGTLASPASNPACAGLSAACLDLLGWTGDVAPTLPTP